MASNTATARIRLLGGSSVMRALRGVRSGNDSANRKARSETKKTERAVEKSADKEEKSQRQAARAGAEEVSKAERKKRSEMKKTTREAQQSNRAQEASAKRTTRAQREAAAAGRGTDGAGRRGRGRGSVARGVAGALAGGALGALHGAASMGSTAQGIIGVRSGQDVLSRQVDVRGQLLRAVTQGVRGTGATADQATVQATTERLNQSSADIGRRTGTSAQEIQETIAVMQTRFSSVAKAIQGGEDGMRAFERQLEFIATTAQATGSSMDTVSIAGTQLANAAGLSADGMQSALALVSQAALDGSLDLQDFGTSFPRIFATFAAARGVDLANANTTEEERLGLVREFATTGQAMQAGGGAGGEATSTALSGLAAALTGRDVQTKLARLGINVAGERSGTIRGFDQIAADVAASGVTLGQLGSVNGLGLEAQRALLNLGAGEGGTTLAARQTTATVDSGTALLAEGAARILDDPALGAAMRARADREARMVEQSEALIVRFASLADTMSQFEDRFPTLTHGGGAGAIGSTVAGLGLGGLLSGGGGGAITGALSSVGSAGMGVLNAGVAAGGATAAGAWTLGAGAAAAVGLGIGRALGHGVDFVTGAQEGSSESLVTAQSDIVATVLDGNRSLFMEIMDGFKSLNEGVAQPRLRQQPQRVELTAGSAAAIAQAAATQAPGSGRRTEGGPAERTP